MTNLHDYLMKIPYNTLAQRYLNQIGLMTKVAASHAHIW